MRTSHPFSPRIILGRGCDCRTVLQPMQRHRSCSWPATGSQANLHKTIDESQLTIPTDAEHPGPPHPEAPPSSPRLDRLDPLQPCWPLSDFGIDDFSPVFSPPATPVGHYQSKDDDGGSSTDAKDRDADADAASRRALEVRSGRFGALQHECMRICRRLPFASCPDAPDAPPGGMPGLRAIGHWRV